MKSDPMPLTREEKDKLLDIANETDEFDYLLYLILITTGRRIGELYGTQEKKEIGRKILDDKRIIYIKGKRELVDRTIPKYKKLNKWKFGVQVKDINFERGTMLTWVLKRRNYVQDESVLTPKVLKLLKSYIRENRLRLDDYVFRKKGRSYRNINNVLKKYAKDSGVSTVKMAGERKLSLSIHSFRHYFITELKRQNWPDDKIMILTGHKTSAVLKTYSHVVPLDIKDEIIDVMEEM